MQISLALLAGCAMVASCASGQTPEFHGHLPIDLPKDAAVNFEADAPASDLVTLLQQTLSGTMGDPSAGGTNKISFKTPLGTLDLDPHDVAELLEPIRELHIVSFSSKDADAMTHYEHQFGDEGLKKISLPVASDKVLMMKKGGSSGRYAVIYHQGDQVSVVRTEGMPDLGSIGEFALQKLCEAEFRAKHKLKI